jgi:REP element-mobilizing transposase RayT
MENYFPTRKSPGTVPESSPPANDPPWLSDYNRAAQHLTRLTLESSAQAALITRDEVLWAYAGQFPQSATRELTETVSRYWDRQKENDLVRFVHLASTRAEHMLYATRLTRNMVLALIFDAETPFGTIHTQVNKLVHSFSASPSEKQDDVQQNGDDGFDASGYPDESEPEASIDPGRIVATPAVTGKDERSDTRFNPQGEQARKIILESVSASVYNLDYACLLVPRFPHHHLTGDLSDRLPDLLQETCIAFGWRLEYLSVRPEYLLWNVNVPPATSPAYLMRIMRQRTSMKIFDEFPRYIKENPSGDFWAPGHLVMGGSQPPPAQLIKDFISQTRQRQGIPQIFR